MCSCDDQFGKAKLTALRRPTRDIHSFTRKIVLLCTRPLSLLQVLLRKHSRSLVCTRLYNIPSNHVQASPVESCLPFRTHERSVSSPLDILSVSLCVSLSMCCTYVRGLHTALSSSSPSSSSASLFRSASDTPTVRDTLLAIELCDISLDGDFFFNDILTLGGRSLHPSLSRPLHQGAAPGLVQCSPGRICFLSKAPVLLLQLCSKYHKTRQCSPQSWKNLKQRLEGPRLWLPPGALSIGPDQNPDP